MRARIMALAATAAITLVACGNPTHPCGTFTFTGAPNANRGVDITNSFAFDPSQCGSNCQASTIAYVQIVRIIDQDTGEFLAPTSQQQARIVTGNTDATQNGWAVDRLDGRVWGYYGRNNDGTFASTLTPGSNTVAAVLRDSPSGWPDHSWFDTVDVPVCIAERSACVNHFLGYFYWLFTVETGGSTGTPFSEIGVDWNQPAVDHAVAQWNATAPGVGKNTFPAFTRL
jgi:hypothetical protein